MVVTHYLCHAWTFSIEIRNIHVIQEITGQVYKYGSCQIIFSNVMPLALNMYLLTYVCNPRGGGGGGLGRCIRVASTHMITSSYFWKIKWVKWKFYEARLKKWNGSRMNLWEAIAPLRARGVKSRMCPPYPQRDRKRRLNGAVCRNHRIKRVVPCRC